MAIPSGNLLQGNREMSVKVDAKARSVGDFDHVIVGNKEGRPIELREVATVVDGIKEQRSLARLGGKDVVALEIQRQTGGNTVAMVTAVEKALEELKPELAKQGVEVVIAKDNARFIINNVEDVNTSIYVGGLLTVIIVFFFLKSWRSTLITSLTLPVSVISTFIIMRALDFTLNTMTLMGLSLAIGILIDDAIVVRENITRHAEMGKDHVTAAREGTAEIGPAVIATTLSILAVFVPVAFMGGIVGKFFFPFGIVVAFAVAISLFVSFTLDPMLSAVWPDPEHEKSADGHVHYKGRNPIMRSVEAFSRMLDRWERLYKPAIEWALDHRWTVMLAGLGSFVLAMGLMGLLGNNFMPDYDRGDLQANFKAEPGSSLVATREKALALEKAIQAVPGVDFTYTTIGTGLNGTVDSGGIYVKLKDGKRPDQVVIRRQIREAFRSVPGVDAAIGAANDWGMAFPIMVAVQAPDRDAVIQAVPLVKEALRSVPGAVDVTTSLDSGKPELRLVVDRKAASDLGVSPALVSQMVRPLVDGEKVAKYEDEKGEQRDVRVRLADQERRFTTQLANMTVQSTKDLGGGKHPLVRLNQVVRFEEGIAPAKLQRHDLMEEVEVDANFDGSTLGEVSAGAAAKVAALKASGKLPEDVRVEFLGQTRDSKETAGYMGTVAPAGGLLHLLRAGQPVRELQAARRHHGQPAALHGGHGADAAGDGRFDVHDDEHRHDPADGPGDQERHPAGGPRPASGAGGGHLPPPGHHPRGHRAAAAHPHDQLRHGRRHAAALPGAGRRGRDAGSHGPRRGGWPHHLHPAHAHRGAGVLRDHRGLHPGQGLGLDPAAHGSRGSRACRRSPAGGGAGCLSRRFMRPWNPGGRCGISSPTPSHRRYWIARWTRPGWRPVPAISNRGSSCSSAIRKPGRPPTRPAWTRRPLRPRLC